MLSVKRAFAGFALCALTVAHALADEYPIGIPQHKAGMEIATFFLEPVEMEPENATRAATDSDIHLQTMVQALASNRNGFAEGMWIPYLTLKYEIHKIDGDYQVSGECLPIISRHGPYYGSNVRLDGPGRYRLRYSVLPPGQNRQVSFVRHSSRSSGVRPWFRPFEVEYEFTFAGFDGQDEG